MPGTPIVSLSGAGKSYGSRRVADDISFEVEAGEIVCLLGASGSGKSTILRMIAGVERADGGTVRIGGVEVDSPGAFVPPEKRRVGLVFQDLALFPHLDATANAAFGLYRAPRAEAQAQAAALLDLVGLKGQARAFPHQLSGGEQQRLAVARALAPRPQVMLLDEPFSGLDDRLRDTVRSEVLSALRAEHAATVFVTHDPDEALRSADRIVLLRAGRIVQIGTPDDLLRAPADLGAASFMSAMTTLGGVVSGGTVMTPFGPVAAAAADGTAVTVAWRQRDFAVAEGGAAVTVGHAALASDGWHVTGMTGDGLRVSCVLDAASPVRAGDVIALTAKPGHGFTFPA
ncbi:MAG: ABC transporter ATP-binding protein [Micropepsaceae bacterium]